MMQEHFQALRAKHEELDRQVSVETARPHPDDTALMELKRQKLRIKDRMSGLAAE